MDEQTETRFSPPLHAAVTTRGGLLFVVCPAQVLCHGVFPVVHGFGRDGRQKLASLVRLVDHNLGPSECLTYKRLLVLRLHGFPCLGALAGQ
ncbi:MAG: hypothetical protein WCL44_15760, partial [bacterium]